MSWLRLPLVCILLASCATTEENARMDAPMTGAWRAWLECPGGELPFGLILERSGFYWVAFIENGSEMIPIPGVSVRAGTIEINIDHYDSVIRATVLDGGRRLEGRWTKRRGADRWARLEFHAIHGGGRRFPEPSEVGTAESIGARNEIAGRWRVAFASSDDPAVAHFDSSDDGTLTGTFMTTTGDYRYLAGNIDGGLLRLSCFDGAHAFLFHAAVNGDGTLSGDFWSSDSWHERWTATRESAAALPDPWKQTTWLEGVSLADLEFPDLVGRTRSLDDPEFEGKVRILQVFGSWCPNCHDAALYIEELYERYRDRGLSVVGLAFELTGDFERDAEQVRRYVLRHGTRYPLLLAGTADKAEATEQLGALDRVRSYPTTIFLDESGRVHAIHTGFTGPATPEYEELRRQFEEVIEELLEG